MSSNGERVFVIGASGNIGADVVRGLVKKEIDTTAYVRDEQKAKDLFKDELNTGHLTIVVGTYSSVDIYTKAIQGHTRLFLLFAVTVTDKPTSMWQIKETFGKIAFEQGVRQIVDLSGLGRRNNDKQGIISYIHRTAEEKLWALADSNPEQRSLVVLRPGSFMTNHFRMDIHHIKHSNKLVSCAKPSQTAAWIDTKDIADCAVAVLSESIEKHDRNIYEMGADCLSNEQRAVLFSKVLGRPITYEQQSMEDFYKSFINFGMPHSFAYTFISSAMEEQSLNTTPQAALLINRPLRTLEQWLKENAKAFQ